MWPRLMLFLDPKPLDGLDDLDWSYFPVQLNFLGSIPKPMIEFGPLVGALDPQLESDEQLPSSKLNILELLLLNPLHGKDVGPEFAFDPNAPNAKLLEP